MIVSSYFFKKIECCWHLLWSHYYRRNWIYLRTQYGTPIGYELRKRLLYQMVFPIIYTLSQKSMAWRNVVVIVFVGDPLSI